VYGAAFVTVPVLRYFKVQVSRMSCERPDCVKRADEIALPLRLRCAS
jgi:hypothetical protein